MGRFFYPKLIIREVQPLPIVGEGIKRELDMSRIFDIHNHILWGVDDGSKDFQMSIRMLEIAVASKTTDIILTPHNKPERRNIYTTEINDVVEQLQKYCISKGINIKFYPGNEIYYRMDVGERIESGKATTMAGSKYVLLEYNPTDDWAYIKNGVDDMLSRGYVPIIAHVERYMAVLDDIDRAYELVNKGCYLQVNAGSVMGDFGYSAKSFSRKLLKANLVSFVASDAHEDKKRTPRMDHCIKYIDKKFGPEMVKKIFEDNPLMVVEDR